LILLYKGWFTATNVGKIVSSSSLLPVASKKDVRVADWSHNLPSTAEGTPVVGYVLNGNSWKAPTDPAVQNQVFAIEHVIRERPPVHGATGVRAVVVAFLGVSLAFLCWFIAREMKQRKIKHIK